MTSGYAVVTNTFQSHPVLDGECNNGNWLIANNCNMEFQFHPVLDEECNKWHFTHGAAYHVFQSHPAQDGECNTMNRAPAFLRQYTFQSRPVLDGGIATRLRNCTTKSPTRCNLEA